MRRIVRRQEHAGLCLRRAGWTYITDDGTFLVRDRSDRYAIGNPHFIRFREDARELFPELADQLAYHGRMERSGWNCRTRDLPIAIAPGARIEHVVMLDRNQSGPTRLRRYPKDQMQAWCERFVNFGSDEVRDAQTQCHRRLLDASLWEMSYAELGRCRQASRTVSGLREVRLLRFLLMSVGLAVSGWGQVSSGSLLGDVRDEKAASVAGVAIQARNNQTGFSRSAVTNDFGSYRIDDLLPGAYTVTAQHDGFQTVTVSPFFVEVDQESASGFRSAPGIGHETVTVTRARVGAADRRGFRRLSARLGFYRGAAFARPQYHHAGDLRPRRRFPGSSADSRTISSTTCRETAARSRSMPPSTARGPPGTATSWTERTTPIGMSLRSP